MFKTDNHGEELRKILSRGKLSHELRFALKSVLGVKNIDALKVGWSMREVDEAIHADIQALLDINYSRWTEVLFGKHYGLTLPQIAFLDPDWLFWAIQEDAFQKYSK